eukprot:Awhi_evm1s2573
MKLILTHYEWMYLIVGGLSMVSSCYSIGNVLYIRSPHLGLMAMANTCVPSPKNIVCLSNSKILSSSSSYSTHLPIHSRLQFHHPDNPFSNTTLLPKKQLFCNKYLSAGSVPGTQAALFHYFFSFFNFQSFYSASSAFLHFKIAEIIFLDLVVGFVAGYAGSLTMSLIRTYYELPLVKSRRRRIGHGFSETQKWRREVLVLAFLYYTLTNTHHLSFLLFGPGYRVHDIMTHKSESFFRQRAIDKKRNTFSDKEISKEINSKAKNENRESFIKRKNSLGKNHLIAGKHGSGVKQRQRK